MGVFEEKMSVFKPLTPESLARILAGGGRRSAGGSDRSDKHKSANPNRSRDAIAENSRKGSTSRSPKQGDDGGGEAQTKALVSCEQMCVKKKQQEPKPNASLVAGRKLPPAFGDYFPKKLYGVPIEDIDPFYSDKKVCARPLCEQISNVDFKDIVG